LFVPAAAIYSHFIWKKPAPLERSLSLPKSTPAVPAIAPLPKKEPIPVADKEPLIASGHDERDTSRGLAVGREVDAPKSTMLALSDNAKTDAIERALRPKPITRGLSPRPEDLIAMLAETKFLAGIRGRSTRSLSASEREEIAIIAMTKPNIDFELVFDFNSAQISAKSRPAVEALGRALANPGLKGSTFVIVGHTDGVGSDAYNQELSERRADSIKQYLTIHYGIASSDLVAVGYGKSRLKEPSRPMSEVNRRVQVFNMTDPIASR
jgi:outer membrane protein OmpA-like peptidoglycan-associated protein